MAGSPKAPFLALIISYKLRDNKLQFKVLQMKPSFLVPTDGFYRTNTAKFPRDVDVLYYAPEDTTSMPVIPTISIFSNNLILQSCNQ